MKNCLAKLNLKSNPFSNKKVLKASSWIMLFAFINLISGCAYHYKVVNKPQIVRAYYRLLDSNNYIILHKNNEAFHFLIYGISEEEEIITGTLQPLPANRTIYKVTDREVRNKYDSKSTFSKPRNEVHIYVQDYEGQENQSIVIHFDQIQIVEVYKGANEPRVISGVLIVLAIMIALSPLYIW